MARFLTTARTLAEIESVIQRATKDVYLISPFVQLSEQLRRRLTDADEKGIRIHVVCRVSELRQKERDALASLTNLSIYDSKRLHAKAFANEHGVVLTSLNLYEASEKNYEMGVYLDVREDREALGDAMSEINSVISHAKQVNLNSKSKARTPRTKESSQPKEKKGIGRLLVRNQKPASKAEGFCIRCGTEKAYDPKRPYCPKCFTKWARFRNPTYADDRCHGCGREQKAAFSLEKPECYGCYKRHTTVAT